VAGFIGLPASEIAARSGAISRNTTPAGALNSGFGDSCPERLFWRDFNRHAVGIHVNKLINLFSCPHQSGLRPLSAAMTTAFPIALVVLSNGLRETSVFPDSFEL
jgi:hypothetical protein